jgi:aspartyl-tRNA(Asn)/glutamyl-tRNA(Gln) amidotransferase subunit A
VLGVPRDADGGEMNVSPFASLRDMRRALDRREVSSVELTKMYLERLKTLGKEHNAVAELTENHALAAARRADESPKKSPLHGIPFGVKDLLATKGIPTRWGSPGHVDQVFDYDSTVVQRLEAAGAVLLAKLEMIELAGGGNYNVANASRMGPCLSAWDKRLWAGGSSSGSGATTALGCVGFSIGSETSGSIVCPSAFNGATGFRPTYGRVSRHGAMALCWTLDKLGPICRSAEDCGTVLSVISGPEVLDPSTLPGKLSLRAKGSKPRIGVLKENFKDAKADAMEKAYSAAIELLKKQGYEVVSVAYPEMPYNTAVNIIVDAEGASAHENFIRSDRFGKLQDVNQVAGFAAAMQTRAVDYLWAMRFRTEALKANSVWEKCDCIFTPTFYHKAVPIDQPFDKTWVGMGGDDGPSNLLCWPALAFPVGFEDGAPIGCQVIAPAMREDTCYRVAMDFQRVTDFHSRRPPGA